MDTTQIKFLKAIEAALADKIGHETVQEYLDGCGTRYEGIEELMEEYSLALEITHSEDGDSCEFVDALEDKTIVNSHELWNYFT